MKTFKQLREAFKKEENPEAKSLRPRAEGEKDFYDSHTREVKDYPLKNAGGEPKGADADHQPSNGDRTRPEQVTSSLKDQSGFKGSKTPLTRADKTQGYFKPVKTSPSAVKAPAFAESVFVNRPIINESDEDVMEFELLNGDVIEINSDIYNSVHEVFYNLNTGNQVIFKSAVNESADSFECILDFVAATLSEDE